MNLTKEQESEVTGMDSGKILTASGKEFFYMPRWFSKNSDGSWERMSFDELPEDAQERVHGLRSWLKNIIP